LVKPNNSTSFTLNLSVPDNNRPGSNSTAQFGPVRVLVGSDHTLHFELQRIPISPDPGDGCYTITVRATGGQIFTKNIGMLTSCPARLIQFNFDVSIPALKCAVSECTLTIDVIRTDGKQINYEVTPTSLRSDTAILQSGPPVAVSTTTKRFSVTISNPGR
jgi:hypothetical protein